jgi:type II secretion system protein C
MKKEGYKMYIRKVLLISKYALVLMLVYVLVRTLVSDYAEQNSSPASALAGAANMDQTTGWTAMSSEDYTEIVERNPFDQSGQTEDSGQWTSTTRYSSTSEELGLALSGTVSGNREVARAIIKDLKTGVPDLYKIDETVGGARVTSIEEDTVVLVSNGQKTVLKLNMVNSNINNGTQFSSDQTSGKLRQAAKTDSLAHKANPNDQTKSGRVEALLNNAVIEPYFADGQAEGLQITGLENISFAKDIGLRNRDVIRSVNGHILTNKQKAYQVLKKAASQPAIDIELLRDNKTKKLSFPM